MNRPLPFTRVIRCDDCSWFENATTYETAGLLMRRPCPCCASVDLTSRPIDIDRRHLTRNALRADA